MYFDDEEFLFVMKYAAPEALRILSIPYENATQEEREIIKKVRHRSREIISIMLKEYLRKNEEKITARFMEKNPLLRRAAKCQEMIKG